MLDVGSILDIEVGKRCRCYLVLPFRGFNRRFGLDASIVPLESVGLQLGNGLRFVAVVHFHYHVDYCAAATATLTVNAVYSIFHINLHARSGLSVPDAECVVLCASLLEFHAVVGEQGHHIDTAF